MRIWCSWQAPNGSQGKGYPCLQPHWRLVMTTGVVIHMFREDWADGTQRLAADLGFREVAFMCAMHIDRMPEEQVAVFIVEADLPIGSDMKRTQ